MKYALFVLSAAAVLTTFFYAVAQSTAKPNADGVGKVVRAGNTEVGHRLYTYRPEPGVVCVVVEPFYVALSPSVSCAK